MKKKKSLTLDDLALMVGKGFNDVKERMDRRFDAVDKRFDAVDQRFQEVDKRFDKVERDIEDVRLRLDNVVYRFELQELERKFEKRIRVLEVKAGLKPGKTS